MPGQLMLHVDSGSLPEKELRKIAPPEPDGRFMPISHSMLLDTTKKIVKKMGLKIEEQQLGVSADRLKFFGVLHLKAPKKNDGFTYSIGMRNGNNRKMAAGLAFGSRVFVCDNMAFHGQTVLRRVHTTNIVAGLERLVEGAMDKFRTFRAEYDAQVHHWKDVQLTNENEVDSFLMESIRRDVMPSNRIMDVWQHWTKPEHKAFKDRNAWSLYNAYTSAFRGDIHQNAFLFADRTIRLGALMSERFPLAVN